MVWGMSIPSSFGDYWPDGCYEGEDPQGEGGWSDRLARFYHIQTPKAQKRLFDYGPTGSAADYPIYVSQKFVSEPNGRSIQFPELPPLNSIKEHEPPRFFITYANYKSLGSLIALNFGLLAVDEHLKSIIEQFDPGIHQFYPIEIRMPRGKFYPAQYYILVIGNYIDGFCPEKSKNGSYRSYGPEYPDYYSLVDTAKGISGISIYRDAFGNAKLWRERGLNEGLTCFSDQLEAEIAKSGLRIPKHYKMIEV